MIQKGSMDTNDLTGKIIGLAMKVHRTLGPGFLESVYQAALLHELKKANIAVECQNQISVHYDGVVVGDFAADMIVENRILLELKAVQSVNVAHEVQVVNYLNATKIDTGLLINFGGQSLEYRRKFRINPAGEKPFSL
jgi:GxxExxY protein